MTFFRDVPEVMLKAITSKGGRARVPKGFAKMSPERLKEVTSKGGIAKRDKMRAGITERPKELTQSEHRAMVDEVLSE